jgi:hypothetical protein
MEARQELDEGTAAYVQARSIAALMQGSHPAGELARDQVAATLIPKMLPYSKVPFYGSGAAICLLLDKYGDDWKNEIEKGSTLFEALKKRAGAGSGKRHYFGDFTTLAKSEVIWNDAKRETVLNDFYDPSKVRLVIEFETKAKDSVASSGSTSSSGDYLLVNNGTLMHLVYVDFHLSSVFNLIVQESSFFFSYKRVPAAGTGPWHIRYELPLLEPERLRITLDGKLLKSRSAEIPFKTIRLKAWNADLKLNVPGVFSMHGKVITVRTGNLD